MTTFFRRALVFALAASAPGCGGSSLPPAANPDQARAALKAALDDWQAGAPADAPAKASPPVYFNDPRRRAGAQLLGYKMEDGHAVHGQSVRVVTVLTLKAPDGATKDRKTNYLIDTTPAVVIVAE